MARPPAYLDHHACESLAAGHKAAACHDQLVHVVQRLHEEGLEDAMPPHHLERLASPARGQPRPRTRRKSVV